MSETVHYFKTYKYLQNIGEAMEILKRIIIQKMWMFLHRYYYDFYLMQNTTGIFSSTLLVRY